MFPADIKILVIDDMLTMRKIVVKTCKDFGFTQFFEAADGELAWKTLNDQAGTIGLVISDWNMPNCSGLDLLKRVRSDARFVNLPFILVTAESEKGQIVDAIKAGVSAYVVKPFTPDIIKKGFEAAYSKTESGKKAG